ncbi:MAG: hypothetical protein HOP04_13270 [Methylophilaceae bacterium]|nr:hypothetical protein [Methylophilaceae bacterium]
MAVLPPSPPSPDLSAFFAPGIETGDLPALYPLLRAHDTLNAFITLFRGGSDEVLIRLLVLREIGARADAPSWSAQELQAHFAYLDTVKLQTVLGRLRDNELLVWDAEDRLYQLSPAGRIALAALANVLELAGEEDAELGFITAQVAAGQAIGRVSTETLQHLLGRLTELQNEFDQAVLSGSEFRLKRAQTKLESVWKWVEKGTEIIHNLNANGELGTSAWRIAQSIAQAQSRMLRMTGVFSRALISLERQRVHLGDSGLSSSDISSWLRGCALEHIADLAIGSVWAHPEPLFVTEQEMLDSAEFELLEREREKAAASHLPPASAAPQQENTQTLRLELLESFHDTLSLITHNTPLQDAVVGGGYAHAAYRFSLLALLNSETESQHSSGAVAKFAQLPIALKLQQEHIAVNRDGVASISNGMLMPLANKP